MAPRGYSPRSSRPFALRLGSEDRVRWTAVDTSKRRKGIQWIQCMGHPRRSEAEANELRQNGSTKEKNFKNALTHAQGGKPLASDPIDQVPAMQQPCTRPYRVPFLWLLPRPPGADHRSRLNGAVAPKNWGCLDPQLQDSWKSNQKLRAIELRFGLRAEVKTFVRIQAQPARPSANFLLIELPSCVKQPSCKEYPARCRSDVV